MSKKHLGSVFGMLVLTLLLGGCFINNVGLGLTIVGSGDVITDPEHSLLGFKKGTVVKLEAVADEGWKFVRWEDDLSGTEPIAIITMNASKDITAIFEETE